MGIDYEDICYECGSYGDDYYFDENGELCSSCYKCPYGGEYTEEEIVATRERAIKELEDRGYDVVNTLFTDEWYSKEKMEERGVVQIPLCFLVKSLENMSLCHTAYFS